MDRKNHLGIATVKAELVIRNNLKYTCLEFFKDIKN